MKRFFGYWLYGFCRLGISGEKDIEGGTKLAQVIKRIGPLENQQRQQYDSADIGD